MSEILSHLPGLLTIVVIYYIVRTVKRGRSPEVQARVAQRKQAREERPARPSARERATEIQRLRAAGMSKQEAFAATAERPAA